MALRLGWLTVLSSINIVEQELAFCSWHGVLGDPRWKKLGVNSTTCHKHYSTSVGLIISCLLKVYNSTLNSELGEVYFHGRWSNSIWYGLNVYIFRHKSTSIIFRRNLKVFTGKLDNCEDSIPLKLRQIRLSLSKEEVRWNVIFHRIWIHAIVIYSHNI